MSNVDKVLRTVAAIHDSALEPSAWQLALGLVGELLNSNGVVVALDDKLRGFTSSFEANTAPEARQAYLTEFHEIDPVIAFVRRAPARRAYSDDMTIARTALLRTRFHADFAKRFDYYHCVQAFTHRSDTASGFFVAARHGRQEPFGEPERRLLETLIPHFEQAFRVRSLLHRADFERESALAALDHVKEGVIFVDGTLRIRFANAEARRLLRRGAGLKDVHSKLITARQADQARLYRAVAQAASGSLDHSTMSLAVSRAPPLRPLLLRVAPISASLADRIGDLDPGALVFIGDPDAGQIDPAIVVAMLGLTPAEAQVASLLATGLDIAGLTIRLRVSQATVRTHLKNIFAKTNTGQQSQLVALINAIPVRSSDSSNKG